MRVEDFIREREPSWRRLDELLAAGPKARRSAADVLAVAALHREAAADLVRARRTYDGHPLVPSLEDLLGRARAVADVPAAPRWRDVVTREALEPLRRDRRSSAVAAAMLLVPLSLALVWALVDADAAARVLGTDLRRPDGGDGLAGLPRGVPGTSAVLTAGLAAGAAALAFAGGLVAGLGTAYVLGTAGLLLGVPAGLAIDGGRGASLLAALVTTGLLELVLLVAMGAAGVRVARALPSGRLAVQARAQEGALLTLLTVPGWAAAALLERLPDLVGTEVAAGVGVLVLGLLVLGAAQGGQARTLAPADR